MCVVETFKVEHFMIHDKGNKPFVDEYFISPSSLCLSNFNLYPSTYFSTTNTNV